MPAIKDCSQFRADFPMLAVRIHDCPLVYLDSAATALKPLSVIEATSRYYSREYGTVHRAVYELAVATTERCAEIRRHVARFIGAASDREIIFTRGTTESINLLASCFAHRLVNVGDEILVSELAHHSNIVPWQMLCERRGANLKVIPVDDRGHLLLEALEERICGRTKVVALSHISNAIGTEAPIQEVVEIAHRYGAKVVVDGAQAAPHLPIDVQALGVDFYAFSGHKLYGPTGIGILYGKEALLNELPPYQGGGDMIERVSFEETTYNVLPFRFEAGTPNIAGILGLGAALDYVEKVGLADIHAWEQQLTEYATEQLQEVEGLKILGSEGPKGAIISFVVDRVHPLDIATLLDLEGICVRSGHHCAQPTMARFGVNATTRVSFALYNTTDEVDLLCDTLQAVIKELR